ncbi:MAG: thiamine phosphate synthase [Ruminococcaceae bacterium]|nr:thiamine phosphate synthase [Oscillospiraceae bacterium]
MNKPDISLYFITDSTGFTTDEFLKIVDFACKGGATIVQLREKNKSTREYLQLALEVKKITDKYEVPLIIDDRVDIALASDAAGVHLGNEDMPISVARKLMGKNKIIGATAKTVEAALNAEKDGADYIGTGAIFPTTTKVKTVLTPISVLKDVCKNVKNPVCAIGGLNYENCDILKNSGISGIAVVSAIMKSTNPEESARKFKEKILNELI